MEKVNRAKNNNSCPLGAWLKGKQQISVRLGVIFLARMTAGEFTNMMDYFGVNNILHKTIAFVYININVKVFAVFVLFMVVEILSFDLQKAWLPG